MEDGGSSPRARGTPIQTRPRRSGYRFIPASAGNTVSGRTTDRSKSVHPRERGEHRDRRDSDFGECGSSPRARGTPSLPAAPGPRRRFIPASAGNTQCDRPEFGQATVHPRERGEHGAQIFQELPPGGSSPRARGTRFARLHSGVVRRFIPASAGNTWPRRSNTRKTPVHPRERGEHEIDLGEIAGQHGSSPRARGTPIPDCPPDRRRRFIPASAGNT